MMNGCSTIIQMNPSSYKIIQLKDVFWASGIEDEAPAANKIR